MGSNTKRLNTRTLLSLGIIIAVAFFCAGMSIGGTIPNEYKTTLWYALMPDEAPDTTTVRFNDGRTWEAVRALANQIAIDDGYLTEYYDGYFCAKESTDIGKVIMEAPYSVVVNNERYVRDSVLEVDEGDINDSGYADKIVAWATLDGCISFQTGSSPSHIVRYSPVKVV